MLDVVAARFDRADRVARRDCTVDGDIAADRAGAAELATAQHVDAARQAAVHRQPAGTHRGAASESVGARERQLARACLGQAAGAADDATKGDVVGAVECQRGIVGNVAHDAACRAAIADLQRAGIDRRAAGIVVVGRQDQRATAGLDDRPDAADDAREGRGVAAVEGQGAAVQDVADDAAAGTAIAKLQGAGRDRGAAGVGVRAGQDERAGAGLGQDAGAGDGSTCVSVVAACVSKVPPPPLSVTARAVPNVAVVRSVPPLKVRPPAAFPRLASPDTCNVPALRKVPPNRFWRR